MKRKNDPRISRLAAELSEAADRMTPQRRAFLDEVVADVFPPDVEQLIEELTPLPESPRHREMVMNTRQLLKAGFVIAVARYSRELKANAEAMAIIGGRRNGGEKGRATQTAASLSRAAQAQAMFEAGADVGEIARKLGCSISTVYRALNTTPATPPRRKR
jgi:hypothetical protein